MFQLGFWGFFGGGPQDIFGPLEGSPQGWRELGSGVVP